MRRREFIPLIGGAAAAWPLTASAQQPARQHRIAFFHPAIPTTLLTETGGTIALREFFGELRRLGYVEGQNLIVERYSAEGHHERYADLAREIVSRNPDVIVTPTNPVVIVFTRTTSTIPVVAWMLDPVKAGLVTSLARPGGNLTGVTLDVGVEIWGKRLEMLERVFAAMEQQRPDAVLVSGEGDLYAHIKLIVELAEKNGLPTMGSYREHVEAGGLMAYGLDLAALARRMAGDVDQILKGAKPGDIPIYQSTTFELLINLKTAKALGIEVPPTLLAQAAEVIE